MFFKKTDKKEENNFINSPSTISLGKANSCETWPAKPEPTSSTLDFFLSLIVSSTNLLILLTIVKGILNLPIGGPKGLYKSNFSDKINTYYNLSSQYYISNNYNM